MLQLGSSKVFYVKHLLKLLIASMFLCVYNMHVENLKHLLFFLQVDDDLRQKGKQLCYGILYGMGNRTLSQHLDVTEIEAAMFMDSFYKTYPAIKVSYSYDYRRI